EFAGIAPNKDAQGRSLKSLLSGGETGAGSAQYTFGESSVGGKAIRSGKWKLIRSGKKTELYDLKQDPGEQKNLAEAGKGTMEELTVKELMKKLSDGLAAGEKDALSEALPAGMEFTVNMTKADTAQREFFRRMPVLGKSRPLR
ncbi:MAG: hypothetical protein KKH28_08285, partial [Elusimicrobia bacterium]|nr:hypothetical protein [Elusimicrobiota bacterium]